MSVFELNQQVVFALRQAMRTLGQEGNISAFTRALRAEAGDAPDASTVGRWLKGEQTVPAWALIAASEASGLSLADLVITETDLAALHREMELLKSELRELEQAESTPKAGSTKAQQDKAGLNGNRIETLEQELEKQGMLLAKILESLDRAGAWAQDSEKKSATGDGG